MAQQTKQTNGVQGNERGFEVRTIKSGEEINCEGWAVEVLDGGWRGSENVIVLGRNLVGTEQAYSRDGALQAFTGSRAVGHFNSLKLLPLRATPTTDQDTVVVRICTRERALVTDAPPQGLTRKRMLARGTISSLSSTQSQRIWRSSDFASGLISDPYSTENRATERGFWSGWIVGQLSFDVIVMVATVDTDGTGSYWPIMRGAARDFSAVPVITMGANHTAGYGFDFSWGGPGLTSTVGIPIPYQDGAVELWIYNSSVSSQDLRYYVGLRGSL